MPDLHRAAVTFLEWTLTLDAPLVTAPDVAIYPVGSAASLTWVAAEWVDASTSNGDGTYTRKARLLVAGPNAVDPDPAAVVLPAVAKYANAVRLVDVPEQPVALGERITVLR